MQNDRYDIEASDLEAYLTDNASWVETYSRLGLFDEAASGFQAGKRSPKTFCPIHGGKSGEAFGFLHRNSRSGCPSSDISGVGVCNSCGVIPPFKLVMEATGWSFRQTLEELAIASGYRDGLNSGVFKVREKSPEQIAAEKAMKERQEAKDAKNLQKIKELWEGAYKLNKPQAAPVFRYLKNRGIELKFDSFGDEVRFHPAVRYIDVNYTSCLVVLAQVDGEQKMQRWWIDKAGNRAPEPVGKEMNRLEVFLKELIPLDNHKAKPAQLFLQQCNPATAKWIMSHRVLFHRGVGFINDLGDHPCILKRIRNPSGTPINLHQTFITLDGKKADVPTVKKMRPAISSLPILGGALQLCPPVPVMGVAEGLETSLSVDAARGMPMWPLLNATLMANWIPPKGVKRVYIWEDPDPAGEGNAQKLADRLQLMNIEPIRVSTKAVRPEGDWDWNDVLIKLGPDAFPHKDWMDNL